MSIFSVFYFYGFDILLLFFINMLNNVRSLNLFSKNKVHHQTIRVDNINLNLKTYNTYDLESCKTSFPTTRQGTLVSRSNFEQDLQIIVYILFFFCWAKMFIVFLIEMKINEKHACLENKKLK